MCAVPRKNPVSITPGMARIARSIILEDLLTRGQRQRLQARAGRAAAS